MKVVDELGGIDVKLDDHMGSDLSVVNAARVTMGVEHPEFEEMSDSRLIRFLARERHVTPFRHPTITLRCKAPIAIARQLGKHQVGFSWNEKSRRYKDDEITVYIPSIVRMRPENLHSGAGKPFSLDLRNDMALYIEAATAASVRQYEGLLALGVAPEQARFVLPQNMVTDWVWTGSLYGWSELYRQRSSAHAQSEVRWFAKQVNDIMKELYPVAWAALTGK